MIAPETRLWLVTDGKAGDVAQCLGIAERLGILAPEQRITRPRAPYTWFMPWGPIDPREAPDAAGSPFAPPFPDMAIASGRRAVAALRAIKHASGGRTFTVFLKDPRIGAKAADFIWMPEHDGGTGENVMKTLTSPHRISPQALGAARAQVPPWGHLPAGKRCVAILLGGDSKDFRFTPADEARLLEGLQAALAGDAFPVVTPSRRTSTRLAEAVARLVEANGGWFWHGEGENPYLAMLAHADVIVATAESVNMVGEAVSTGKGVYLFRPTGQSRKIDRFLEGLKRQGAIRPFTPALEGFTYPPIDSTPLIAAEIARRYHAFRAAHLAL